MRTNDAKRIALCGVSAALSLLFLFLAGILPTMRIVCYLLSSFFIYVSAREVNGLFGLLAFFVCCCLGFLLLPNKLSLLPYVALLGHYGVFSHFLRRVTARWQKLLLALLYCDFFTALAVLFYAFILKMDIFAIMPALPGWLIIAGLQLALLVYILLFAYAKPLYESRLRRLLRL